MKRTPESERAYRATLPLAAGRQSTLNAAINRDREGGADVEWMTTEEQREFVRRWLDALDPDGVEAVAKSVAVQAAFRAITRYPRRSR